MIDLIENKSIGGPRFESPTRLMASGIGGSAQDAIRLATTQLAEWLVNDYALSASEVALVLGTSIRYDIAELVDPQIHVVARVDKEQLSTLGK